jgi:aldehyde dehydrogenase (NAD+)
MAFLKHPGCIYIGGEWQPTDRHEPVINPADESVLIDAPVGSAAQVEAAIAAARHAFDHSDWPHLPVAQRQALMTRFLDAIDARRGEFVDLIVAEAGATRMLAEFLQYGIPMKHARR